MFEIRNNKILWPFSELDRIRSQFELHDGVGLYENDFLTLAENAETISIPEISPHYNKILAGTFGIDLEDVAQAIKQKVETTLTWENFNEYKELRKNTRLTWEEFVNHFDIDTIEDNP